MRSPKLFLALVCTVAVAATAAVAFAAGPSLSVSPSKVHRGGRVTFTGAGWARKVKVTLLLGRPNTEANRFATVTTNALGRFRYSLPIKPTAPTGRYVILACRRSCATKVSRSMTILP